MDNIQGIPAKMLQASRKNRIRLDDSEAHTNVGSETHSADGITKNRSLSLGVFPVGCIFLLRFLDWQHFFKMIKFPLFLFLLIFYLKRQILSFKKVVPIQQSKKK